MALINQGGGRSLEGEGCLNLNLLSSQVNLTLDLTGSGGPYKGDWDIGKGVTISTTDGERDDLFVVCLLHIEKSPNSKPTPNNCQQVDSKKKTLPAAGGEVCSIQALPHQYIDHGQGTGMTASYLGWEDSEVL